MKSEEQKRIGLSAVRGAKSDRHFFALCPSLFAPRTAERPILFCSSPFALRLLALLIMACVGAGGMLNAPAQTRPPTEYQVKAVFLYNFAKFVEWPDDAFADASAPIVLGILGDDPFGDVLDQALKNKTVNGRALLVKRAKRVQDLKGCHIVFISASERKHVAEILEALNGLSVLTIGETERFAHLGGIINFIIEANKVHFEINVDVAQHAQLKISSRLLALAKIVRDDRHAGGK